jgi:hypothetical protein
MHLALEVIMSLVRHSIQKFKKLKNLLEKKSSESSKKILKQKKSEGNNEQFCNLKKRED